VNFKIYLVKRIYYQGFAIQVLINEYYAVSSVKFVLCISDRTLCVAWLITETNFPVRNTPYVSNNY